MRDILFFPVILRFSRNELYEILIPMIAAVCIFSRDGQDGWVQLHDILLLLSLYVKSDQEATQLLYSIS